MDTKARENVIKAFLPTAIVVLVYTMLPAKRVSKELDDSLRQSNAAISEKEWHMRQSAVRTQLTAVNKEVSELKQELERLVRANPAVMREKQIDALNDRSTNQVKILTELMTDSGLQVKAAGVVKLRSNEYRPFYIKAYQERDEVLALLDMKSPPVAEPIVNVATHDRVNPQKRESATADRIPQGILWRIELMGDYAAMQRMLQGLYEIRGVIPRLVQMTTPMAHQIGDIDLNRNIGQSVKVKSTNVRQTHWTLELWL